MSKQRAVFLDRDGTIIVDVGYPSDPRDVQLLPGVTKALCLLHDAGFLLVIISNQSGIGRGMFTQDDMQRVHDRFVQLLAAENVTIDGTYYCPHAPSEDCACRKPNPGMLLTAADELSIDLSSSFMIGDKSSDVTAGRRAGCRSIRITTDTQISQESQADATLPDLLSASNWILRMP